MTANQRTSLNPIAFGSDSLPVDVRRRPAPARAPAVLRNGTTLRLERSKPADRLEFAAFLEHLSERSRYLRFLQSVPRVTTRMVEYLVDTDDRNHVAWLAWDVDKIVGEARFVRTSPTASEAEIAIAVADEYQGCGLGRCLIERVVADADAFGLTTLTFSALPENRASIALLRSFGAETGFDDGLVAGAIDVARAQVPNASALPASA